jgi:hypothetical protein
VLYLIDVDFKTDRIPGEKPIGSAKMGHNVDTLV